MTGFTGGIPRARKYWLLMRYLWMTLEFQKAIGKMHISKGRQNGFV
jgi:hypothetical protein